MGQVALGFRSLIVKLVVFFIMAALLAWALGGTLWPRPVLVDEETVSLAGTEYFWRLRVAPERDDVTWSLFMQRGEGEAQPVSHPAAGPCDDKTSLWVQDGVLYWGASAAGDWSFAWFTPEAPASAQGQIDMSDRLAVELRFQALRSGVTVGADTSGTSNDPKTSMN